MNVYIIRDAEERTLEICNSLGTAFAWVCTEYDRDFKVKRIDERQYSISFEFETIEIYEWHVLT